MSDYVPFLIFGIALGSVYGLAAMGLVLTYKTSGLFNIAQGAISAAGAYVFYELRDDGGLPWPLAALVVLLLFGLGLGFVLERMSAALRDVPTAPKIVATIGLLVAIQSLLILRYGYTGLSVQSFLPQGQAFTLTGVPVTYDQLIVLGLGVASAGALYVFFKRTRLGTAMRAVVDDQELLDQTGFDPFRIRLSAWVIGSCFAAAAGVLLASIQLQLDVFILSVIVIQAFGAAAIGRFTSLPWSFVGGLAVGILQGVTSKLFSSHQSLSGIDFNMPFIVLFGILVFARRGWLVEVGREIKTRAVPASRFPMQARAGGYAVLLVVALLVPTFAGTKISFYNAAVSSVVLFLSLSLLVRTSGQISLCHIGFAAVGAAGFAHMLGKGMPWFAALLVGGLLAVPIGAVIAIPAIRLSGLYLALATLGFGILLAQYAYSRDYMFGSGVPARRPSGFSDDKHYYYLLLVIALLAIAVVVVIEATRMGRLLRGMADSHIALTTLGANVKISRVIVFCISAFMAGIAGATTAGLFARVSQDTFSSQDSLVILAFLAISGRRTVLSAIVAAVLFNVLPAYVSGERTTLWSYVIFGLAAIVLAANSQGGVARQVGELRARRHPVPSQAAHRRGEHASARATPPGAGESSDLPAPAAVYAPSRYETDEGE
jgi:branched-subunit amino acid ABC-type transport system permease component